MSYGQSGNSDPSLNRGELEGGEEQIARGSPTKSVIFNKLHQGTWRGRIAPKGVWPGAALRGSLACRVSITGNQVAAPYGMPD